MRLVARIIVLLLAIISTAVVTVEATSSPAHAKDANCSDFGSQASAQSYFINHGGPSSDPDGLDSDGDGIACESNPCPCSNNTGGGGGGCGGSTPPPKKKHSLTGKVVRKGPAKKMVLQGKVTTFKGGKIQIQRKQAGGGFRAYRAATASKKSGAFSRPLAYVGNLKTCFQVIAPETKHYLRTVKFLGCFFKP